MPSRPGSLAPDLARGCSKFSMAPSSQTFDCLPLTLHRGLGSTPSRSFGITPIHRSTLRKPVPPLLKSLEIRRVLDLRYLANLQEHQPSRPISAAVGSASLRSPGRPMDHSKNWQAEGDSLTLIAGSRAGGDRAAVGAGAGSRNWGLRQHQITSMATCR